MHKSKKIVLLGHFGVGKTSLIRKFVENEFSESYKVTIGVHISKKKLLTNTNEEMSLIIWDIEGTKDLKSTRSSYLLGTHGVLYVFDVNRPTTYNTIDEDLLLINKWCPKAPIKVIGNKIDLLTEEDIRAKLEKKIIHNDFLTSAKTGNQVETSFYELAKELS